MNIEDLISRYMDGDLPGDGEAELHHKMAVSPEHRKLFREQLMLRSIARDRRVMYKPSEALRSALFERLEAREGLRSAMAFASAAIAAPAFSVSEAGSGAHYA